MTEYWFSKSWHMGGCRVTQHEIYLQTLRDLSCGSAFLPSTTGPVSDGWNLDDKINAQAAIILVCMMIPPPPPPHPNSWSVHVIVCSALCVWIKFPYFSEEWQWFIWTKSLRTHIWKNNQSPYDAYQSGQQEITYPAKLISNNFQSVNRGHSPKDGIWNNPMCLV